MINKKTAISDSFCILPWTHLMIQPNGNIQPCCMTPHDLPIGNTKNDTLEDIWNGNDMLDIRKKMLHNEKPSLCNRCYLMEDNDVLSPRLGKTQEFSKSIIEELISDTDKETGYNSKFLLKYWDFRFSNICNFKCRMCGTFASSRWDTDELAIRGSRTSNGLMNFRTESKEDIMVYIDRFINDVVEIYFAGGEPLFMDEHYIILEKLIKAGRTDVTIKYNTNFSKIHFKNWDLLKLWKPFINNPKGRIELTASLDGVSDVAEFIRHGTVWSEIRDNIKKISNLGIDVYISPTISILNIFHITDLFDTIIELGIKPDNMFYNNILTNPEWYDIRLLPDNLKDDLTNKLNLYYENLPYDKYKNNISNAINAWIKFLYSDINLEPEQIIFYKNELVRISSILDVRRKENFLKINPQYTEWFDEILNSVKEYETEEHFLRDRTPLPINKTHKLI